MPVGFMVREEETDPAFPSLTKADVERRVEDWLQRLERLYRGIAQWADERGWSVDRAQTVEIHEELMRRFAVPARRQPVLRIEDGHSGYALFKPKGLWVIGANGRVDLFTSRGVYILVDFADHFAEPNWMIISPNQTFAQTPFRPELLVDYI